VLFSQSKLGYYFLFIAKTRISSKANLKIATVLEFKVHRSKRHLAINCITVYYHLEVEEIPKS
jgi:hypothetical protein